MNEAMRLEIVQRRQSGMSQQAIANELGISRGAVQRALERVQAQRDGQAPPPRKPRPRMSIIDPFEPILRELLAKYPNLTAERAVQELQARGFTGKYTVVHRRLRLLRPRATPAPVPRFETREGARKRKWIMASMTSTSHAKAGGASISSVTCSVTHAGSTCAS